MDHMYILFFIFSSFNIICSTQKVESDPPPSTIPDANALIGIVKGLANGDFIRNIFEVLGLRHRNRDGTLTDIPWPSELTESINVLEKNLMNFLQQMQLAMRSVEQKTRSRPEQEAKV